VNIGSRGDTAAALLQDELYTHRSWENAYIPITPGKKLRFAARLAVGIGRGSAEQSGGDVA